MKKILIFMMLSLVITAQSNKEIAKESAQITNKKLGKEMNRLLTVDKEIFIDESNFMTTQELHDKIDKLNNYSKTKIILGYGLTTDHYTSFDSNSNDYEFNENNNLVTIEYEKNNKSILLGSFTNSFGNESYMLLAGYKFDKNYKGFYSIVRAGICKGYNSVDYLESKTQDYEYSFVNPTVFYKDYSAIGSIGVGYTIKDVSLECNLLGTAVVSAVKVSF